MTGRMKELVVISGKGGTGKTSLTASFASLSGEMVLCDADVDAADLHLLIGPRIQQRSAFLGGGQAVIIQEKCTGCGRCYDLCRFRAIKDHYEIDPISCEGCGVCVDLCPEQAIDFPTRICGEWYISDTRFGPMVHARLGIAEENSGRLVTLVRREAKKIAEENTLDMILTDGPPGVGCPVIASIGGATALLIVTEPTVSGIHDMERVTRLAHHFKVPAMICVNKYDLNQEQTKAIETMARRDKIPVIGHIPFDPAFSESMVQGRNIIDHHPQSETGHEVRAVWEKALEYLALNG